MNACIDIGKRSFFMGFFIIVLPLLAYMIHNGSSAFVALGWYALLSIVIPWCYLSFDGATFGTGNHRIYRLFYVIGWALVQGITYQTMQHGIVDMSFLWAWPSIGRDIFFLVAMYSQVTVALLIGYALSRLSGGRYE